MEKNQNKLFKNLKLTSSLSLNNLVGFNSNNLIRRYKSMK
jgi:hypothetical protein